MYRDDIENGRLYETYLRTGSQHACAAEYGLTRAPAFRRAIEESGRAWSRQKQTGQAEEAPETLSRELPGKADVLETWERLIDFQGAIEAGNPERDAADVTIATEKPIGVVLTADWHIGAGGTDHAELLRFVLQWLVAPGMYGCHLGDGIDNFVAHSPDGGRFDTVARPGLQKSMLQWAMKLLRGKLLAYLGGQHEFFSERLDDFNVANWAAQSGGCVSLGPGGVLNVTVGETEYTFGLRHKYKGRSAYSETAEAKNFCRDYGPFDVTATGDKHSPAVSKEFRQGANRVFVRAGTFKLRDGYAKSLGYGAGSSAIGCPVVILWPQQKRFEVIEDWDMALAFLAHLRGEEDIVSGATLDELAECMRVHCEGAL